VEKVWTIACCFPLDGSTRFFGGTGWKEEKKSHQSFEAFAASECIAGSTSRCRETVKRPHDVSQKPRSDGHRTIAG